jgi:hypothetical protein
LFFFLYLRTQNLHEKSGDYYNVFFFYGGGRCAALFVYPVFLLFIRRKTIFEKCLPTGSQVLSAAVYGALPAVYIVVVVCIMYTRQTLLRDRCNYGNTTRATGAVPASTRVPICAAQTPVTEETSAGN